MRSEHPSTEHTPLSWLWVEIERRFGKDAALELYAGYLAEQRRYQKDNRDRKTAKRERERI